jgi:RHS repeat-associated protein
MRRLGDVKMLGAVLGFGFDFYGNSKGYPHGFNGKRQDAAIFGEGNAYDFGARMYDPRMYDPRIGRWITVDAMAIEREWLSPYNYVQNSPIIRIDPDGNLDDNIEIEKSTGKITITETNGPDVVRLMDKGKVLNQYSYGADESFTTDNSVTLNGRWRETYSNNTTQSTNGAAIN